MINTYISLDELKKHLNIETEFTDDDTYLKHTISVAELSVISYCNGGLIPTAVTDELNVETLVVPDAVKHGILLLASHLYLNRNPIAFTATTEIPLGFKYLLNPYRNYVIK